MTGVQTCALPIFFGMALITVIVFSPTGVAGMFDRWILGKKPSVKVGGH